MDRGSFEHLPIRPVVFLSIYLDGLVPAPLVLQELLILGLGRIELAELVALIVGCDIEGGESLVATDEEGTSDDGVVAGTVDGGSAEEVFAAAFETSEESP